MTKFWLKEKLLTELLRELDGQMEYNMYFPNQLT
jgi:hypothetical protein